VPQFSELPLPAEPGDLDDVEAEVPDFRRPTYKLFDPAHIGLAALFAGPVGPFVMLALNYWRLGRPSEAGLVLAGGAIMTAAVAVLSLALPDSVPGLLLGFPLFLGLWFASKGLQGQTFLEHRNSGGAAVSGWAVTGIAALGMMLFAGLVVGMAILHEVEVRPRGLR
jgi:hypothetical protein